MDLNFNIYESLGTQIINLENQLKQLRQEQLIDNDIIWKLQLENNAFRQAIRKYASHHPDCHYEIQVDQVDNCYCGLDGVLSYFGVR